MHGLKFLMLAALIAHVAMARHRQPKVDIRQANIQCSCDGDDGCDCEGHDVKLHSGDDEDGDNSGGEDSDVKLDVKNDGGTGKSGSNNGAGPGSDGNPDTGKLVLQKNCPPFQFRVADLSCTLNCFQSQGAQLPTKFMLA